MSTQIQTRVKIRIGNSDDDTVYLDDKESLFLIGAERDDWYNAVKLKIGDVLSIEGKNVKIEDVWVRFLEETIIRSNDEPSTGYQLSPNFGNRHSYNCEIIFQTQIV